MWSEVTRPTPVDFSSRGSFVYRGIILPLAEGSTSLLPSQPALDSGPWDATSSRGFARGLESEISSY